jgi:hypothetical protein
VSHTASLKDFYLPGPNASTVSLTLLSPPSPPSFNQQLLTQGYNPFYQGRP